MSPNIPVQEPKTDVRVNETRRDPISSADTPRASGPAKAGQLKTAPELIEYAYSLKGKQFKVPQKVLKDIARSTSDELLVDEGFRDRLAALITADPLLTVPPRLLVGLEEADVPRMFKLRITRLLHQELRRHPLLASVENGVEPGEGGAPIDRIDVDVVSKRIPLRTSDITPATLGIQSGTLKPAERDRLRANAITTVALIASTLEEWNVDQLVEYLEQHLWRDAVAKPGALRARVAIAESSHPEALGLVAKVFRDREENTKRASETAFRAAAEAEDRATNLLARAAAADDESERLRSVVDGQRSEIEVLQGRIQALQGQIDAEKRERLIDQSHHIDDYERLRTRIVRSLGKQINLLSDGLVAIRDQRYSVTEDFIERSLESLAKELHQLNSEGAAT